MSRGLPAGYGTMVSARAAIAMAGDRAIARDTYRIAEFAGGSNRGHPRFLDKTEAL
jgi:hypothetical protein